MRSTHECGRKALHAGAGLAGLLLACLALTGCGRQDRVPPAMHTVSRTTPHAAASYDPLQTFGGAGVVRIPRMQRLLLFICANGYEHHVAANLSTTAGPVYEAATNYLG